MKYEIYEKIEISDEIYFKSDITSYRKGKFDTNDLKKSKWENIISEIPQSKIEELNEKGETTFTVITKSTIVLTKQL